MAHVIIHLAIVLALLFATSSASTCPSYATLVIGCFSTKYASHPDANCQGLTVLRVSDLEVTKVAEHDISFAGPDPAYVAIEGDSLHIANAHNKPDGALTTLTFTNTAPYMLRQQISFKEEHPAHVSVAYPYGPEDPVILVANWFGGTAYAFKKSPKTGLLYRSGMFTVPAAINPPPGLIPHVHSVFPYRQSVIVAAYGSNFIYRVAISREGALTPIQEIPFNDDDHPRHSVIHTPTDTVFVLNEISQSIVVLKRGLDDVLRPTQRVPVLHSEFFSQTGTRDPWRASSAIRLSNDYRFLYAATRRDPEIGRMGVYQVLPNGDIGKYVGEYSTHGVHPRDFFLAENIRVGGECRSYIAVTHMKSNNFMLIRRDPETGELADGPDLHHSLHTPTSIMQI